MMDLTLVVLAAGLSSRYGSGVKQVDTVGPEGESLLDYGVYDAIRAGFSHVVFVTRPDLQAPMEARVARLPPRVTGDVVFQRIDDLPDSAPAGGPRDKPWGTGHAVLSAAGVLRAPFAVVNADDFYGADAYRRMATFLRDARYTHPHPAAMIGYRLGDTLSAHGGVSRAICDIGPDGHVVRVTEIFDVVSSDAGLRGVAPGGISTRLDPSDLVSMNFWGFQPPVLGMLRERFLRFLEQHGTDPDAEFLLSTAVNDLVASHQITLRVLPTDARWFGMTSFDDRRAVSDRLAALVARSEYPRRLFDGG